MPKRVNFETLSAEIGARLRAYREEYGLNQTEFADGVGIPRPQLARYEAGEDLPQLKAVINLSIYMEHPVDWIVFGEDVPGVLPADVGFRECLVEIERSSLKCRRAAMELLHALIMNDRAEQSLLAAGREAGLERDRAKIGEDT